MTTVEGKLSIWIKSGSFSHASDLYISVLVDDKDIWRTDDKDGYSPDWDSTVVKHIKGDYEKVVLKLMDEDTFSRDDVIATAEFPIADLLDDGLNDTAEMCDADGNVVGTVDININFEEGDGKLLSDDEMLATMKRSAQALTSKFYDDARVTLTAVGMFDLLGSMLHKTDDD